MARPISQALGAAALGAAACGVGAYAYARFVEPRWLERTYTRVHVDGLPAALDGLRIAHLSDFHVHDGATLDLARRACHLALDADPHLVALTGDFITEGAGDALDKTMQMLDDVLRAPLGVWAVPGNHEHYDGIAAYARAVDEHRGVRDLTDEAVRLDWNGATLRLAGTDTASGDPHPQAALDDAPPADCTILLTHNPDLAEDAVSALGRVDLVLSGHTHGGQVRVPGIGALVNSAEHEETYEAGLVRRPWAQVYVSRGVGTVHRHVRFWCRPEVAILELTPA